MTSKILLRTYLHRQEKVLTNSRKGKSLCKILTYTLSVFLRTTLKVTLTKLKLLINCFLVVELS